MSGRNGIMLTAAVSAGAALLVLTAAAEISRAQTPTPGSATATPGAQVDLAAIQQQQIDALNNGDVAKALTYLTDNATVQGSAGCITPCVGKAAIQKEYESEVASHTHVTRVNYQVSGSTVTGRFEVTNDIIHAAGVDRVAGSFTVEFTGSEISSIRLQIDLTDPQTAKFVASLTAKPPNTGSGGYLAGSSSAPWPGLAGVAAVAALVLLGLAGIGWSAQRMRR